MVDEVIGYLWLIVICRTGYIGSYPETDEFSPSSRRVPVRFFSALFCQLPFTNPSETSDLSTPKLHVRSCCVDSCRDSLQIGGLV
jgi:hypothetical protein